MLATQSLLFPLSRMRFSCLVGQVLLVYLDTVSLLLCGDCIWIQIDPLDAAGIGCAEAARPIDPAIVGDIERAVGAELRAVRAAAGGSDRSRCCRGMVSVPKSSSRRFAS